MDVAVLDSDHLAHPAADPFVHKCRYTGPAARVVHRHTLNQPNGACLHEILECDGHPGTSVPVRDPNNDTHVRKDEAATGSGIATAGQNGQAVLLGTVEHRRSPGTKEEVGIMRHATHPD
jgi:hypothetical protein